MSFKVIVLFGIVLAVKLTIIQAHGRVTDPAHRGYAWRLGFKTPADYSDTGNYCGGISTQYQKNKGNCGPCGDNYSDKRPRKNENGGLYGTGTIVKTYGAGSEIEVDVQLTASHKGYFVFSLCPLKSKSELETEECFDAHKLQLADGSGYKFTAIDTPRHYKIKLLLPQGVTCEHCVFRWHYRAGNSWGNCGDGTGALGCGNQETFRTCSDIKIVQQNQPSSKLKSNKPTGCMSY